MNPQKIFGMPLFLGFFTLLASNMVLASNVSNFIDGNFEQAGSFGIVAQSVDSSRIDDPSLNQWAKIIANPDFLLRGLWNISGNVHLVRDGENSLVELTQGDGTELGQLILLNAEAQTLDFDLTIIETGVDDSLEVYFGPEMVGSIPLSSYLGGPVSFPITKFAGRNNSFSFRFNGSLTDPAIIRLDNIRIIGPGIINVLVPDVLGLLQADAEILLLKQGLRVGEIHTITNSALSGTVIMQSPGKNSQVSPEDSVDLVISSSATSTLINVPNVVGQTRTDAEMTLTALKLVIKITEVSSSSVPIGIIISQNPESGTSVTVGSIVNVTVSKGPLLGDLNGDSTVDCIDLGIVKASFGKKTGQTGFDERADINKDGVVNIRDLTAVSQKLPAGTKCL